MPILKVMVQGLNFMAHPLYINLHAYFLSWHTYGRFIWFQKGCVPTYFCPWMLQFHSVVYPMGLKREAFRYCLDSCVLGVFLMGSHFLCITFDQATADVKAPASSFS
jgi:hypothetical protein